MATTAPSPSQHLPTPPSHQSNTATRPSRPFSQPRRPRHTTNLTNNPAITALSASERSTFELVSELKPDLATDAVLELCRQHAYNLAAIETHIAQQLEFDRPAHDQESEQWQTVGQGAAGQAGAAGGGGAGRGGGGVGRVLAGGFRGGRGGFAGRGRGGGRGGAAAGSTMPGAADGAKPALGDNNGGGGPVNGLGGRGGGGGRGGFGGGGGRGRENRPMNGQGREDGTAGSPTGGAGGFDKRRGGVGGKKEDKQPAQPQVQLPVAGKSYAASLGLAKSSATSPPPAGQPADNAGGSGAAKAAPAAGKKGAAVAAVKADEATQPAAAAAPAPVAAAPAGPQPKTAAQIVAAGPSKPQPKQQQPQSNAQQGAPLADKATESTAAFNAAFEPAAAPASGSTPTVNTAAASTTASRPSPNSTSRWRKKDSAASPVGTSASPPPTQPSATPSSPPSSFIQPAIPSPSLSSLLAHPAQPVKSASPSLNAAHATSRPVSPAPLPPTSFAAAAAAQPKSPVPVPRSPAIKAKAPEFTHAPAPTSTTSAFHTAADHHSTSHDAPNTHSNATASSLFARGASDLLSAQDAVLLPRHLQDAHLGSSTGSGVQFGFGGRAAAGPRAGGPRPPQPKQAPVQPAAQPEKQPEPQHIEPERSHTPQQPIPSQQPSSSLATPASPALSSHSQNAIGAFPSTTISSPARFPTSGASPILSGLGASANTLSAEQQGATKPIGPPSNRGVVGPPSTPSSLPSSASSQDTPQPTQSGQSDDYTSYTHEPSANSHSEYGEQADDGGLSTSLMYDDPSQLHPYGYPQPVGLDQLGSPPGVYDQSLGYQYDQQQQQYGADYNMYGYDHFGMQGAGFNQQRGPQKQQQQHPRGPLNPQQQQQQQQQQRPGLPQSQQPYRPQQQQQQQQPQQGLGQQSMYGKPVQGLSPQDKLQQPVQPQQLQQQGVGVGQQKKFAGAPGPIQQQPSQQQQQAGLQQVRPQGLNGNGKLPQGPSSSPQPGQQPQSAGLQQQRPPAQGAPQLQQPASIYGYDQQQRGAYNAKPAPYQAQPLGPYGAKPQQPNSPQSYKQGGYNKQQQQYGKQQHSQQQQQQQFPAAPYPGMQPGYPPYGYPYSGYPVPAPYGYPQPQYQQGPPGFAQRGGYQPAPAVPYQQQYGSGYTSPSDYSQQPYDNAQAQAQQAQHDYGKYGAATGNAGGFGGNVPPTAGGDSALDTSYGAGDWQQQQQQQPPQQPQQTGPASLSGPKKPVGPDSDPIAAQRGLAPYQSYPLAGQPGGGAGHVGPQQPYHAGGVAGGGGGVGGGFGHGGVVGAGVPPPSGHANAYNHPAPYEQRQYQGSWAPSM